MYKDIQDYFISILTFAFFYFQFNMMEDKRGSIPSYLCILLNGKIIESEFLACCMCSSFEYGIMVMGKILLSFLRTRFQWCKTFFKKKSHRENALIKKMYI